jgi:thiol-disulfide isomerase/thioredoxin
MRRTVALRSGVGVLCVLLAAACGSGGDSSTESDAAPPSETTASVGDPTDTSGPVPSVDLAEWQEIEVTDADGQTFTFADLVGRPVFVESFATWCSNCRRQLGDTNEAAAAAGENAVFVALSVETDLDEGDMADYAADQGFDHIRFAVMSPEMLAAFNDAFGNTALNPPSTPHVSVSADGTVGELVTGFDSPEEILASLDLG